MTSPQPAPASLSSLLRRRRVHPAVTMTVTLATLLSVTVAGGLWHLRRDTLETQAQALASLASASADEMERSVQGVVLALQSTREDIRKGHPGTVAQLQRQAELLPLVRQIWIVDARGRVLAESGDESPPSMGAYLPAPMGLDDEGVAFSLPFIDPEVRDASIALAIRWTQAGSAGGWALATMPAISLLGAFPRAALSPDTRLAVQRSDGAVLAGTLRQTARRAEPRRDTSQLLDDTVQRFDDGSRRLLQQRRIEPLGLTLTMTRDVDAALARWREIRQITLIALATVLLGLALLLWRLLRAEAQSRQLQERLGRAQKLESLGTLAGGVAHDFNNILAAVLGFGEMARQAAPDGSAQARQLDQVIQAALRGKGVIERILAFSRSGVRPPTPFFVQPVVEQVLGLLAATLPAGVRVETSLLAPQAQLSGDSTGLFEAVMNLCTNALQAMHGSGVLSVGLLPTELAAARTTSHGSVAPGRVLQLWVADTGDGIAPAVMERLFDPFFTTRGQQGTGLGLAVVHGVVEALGGAIDVDGRPGAGSRFTLWLPLAEMPLEALIEAPGETSMGAPPRAPLEMPPDTPPDTPLKPPPEPVARLAANAPAADAAVASDQPPGPALLPQPDTAALPHGQGQTVLVVDDERALVELAEEVLASLGYEPVGLTDPLLALAELRAAPERFDLVITDQVMPGLTGTELATRLHALRPDLPVLLLSGYGGPQLAQRAADAGIRRVLAKPLEQAALAQALAETLADQARQAGAQTPRHS